MDNLATLPAPVQADSTVRLPITYEAARTAIAECERIDECKTWADKAAALASYARQAQDDSLKVMALRIQARAERRCGELLKQIPAQSTANLVQNRRDGTVLSVTRAQAATEAGLSERQRKTAQRIASVPPDDFERQIESPEPPTITRLAEQGTVPRAVESRIARDDRPDACEALTQFARFCGENEPVSLARGCDAEDAQAMRRCLAPINRWLERFDGALGEQSAP